MTRLTSITAEVNRPYRYLGHILYFPWLQLRVPGHLGLGTVAAEERLKRDQAIESNHIFPQSERLAQGKKHCSLRLLDLVSSTT